MKVVKLTADDLGKLEASLPAEKAPPIDYHQEDVRVDALSIAQVRPSASDDPRTNTYSIGFRCGDSDYTIVVRPTVHQIPAITVNVVRDTEVASYTVLRDTVTTLKGQVSGLPADRSAANFDLSELIGHLKVQ